MTGHRASTHRRRGAARTARRRAMLAVSAMVSVLALATLVWPAAGAPPPTWTAPEPLNSTATNTFGQNTSAQLATDGAGTWVSVWQSTDSLGGTIGTDADILFARSTDSGASWSDAAPLNTNAATDSGHDWNPQVTTDGAGTWVAVWESRDTLGDTIGTDWDILFARSTDAGATWSDPEPLNTNAATDSGNDWNPQVTTDGAGTWVAVWESRDTLGDTIGTDWDILFARSTDAGATWSDPEPLNTNAATDSGNDRNPQVTTGGAGTWVVVWESNDSLGDTIGTDWDILFARSTDAGATWSDPEPLNTNAATDSEHDENPQVTTDGAGVWVAVWQSRATVSPDILTARSTDSGATWSNPEPLHTTTSASSGRPHVATDGVGAWVAVWESSDSLGGIIGTDWDILFARSIDGGITWSDVAPLNANAATDSGTDFSARVTTDGTGTWVAVWFSGDSLGGTIGTNWDVIFARSTDGGATWSDPEPLTTRGVGDDVSPQVTTDGAGTWVAVWESSDNLGATIGTDRDILFARSTDSGTSWSDAAPLNTNAGTGSGDDRNPQVTTDGAGTWVAVWDSDDSLGGAIGTDRDILFARSTDGGETWSDPEPLNTSAATDSGHDQNPQVTTDGAGTWVAVWQSTDTLGGSVGTDWDILVARSTDGGETWSNPEPLNNNAAFDSGDDERPQVTTDGAGTWVAVWDSNDSLGDTFATGRDILFARSTDGGTTWSDPAFLNAPTARSGFNNGWPQLTTDGDGIWVAAWNSNDSLGGSIGTDADILFARSTDDGETWSAPAPLNTNAATGLGNDVRPQLTTDGNGIWVAVWDSTDSLGGTIGADRDILFAHSTDGGTKWSDPAPLNTNAATDSGYDERPQVTTDGAGTWLATWDSSDSLGGTIGVDSDILFARTLSTNIIDTSGDGYTDGEKMALGKDAFDYCAIMRADVNHDQSVNILDVSLVSGWFGSAIPPAPERYDQNADDAINILDISLVAGHFGTSVMLCP